MIRDGVITAGGTVMVETYLDGDRASRRGSEVVLLPSYGVTAEMISIPSPPRWPPPVIECCDRSPAESHTRPGRWMT